MTTAAVRGVVRQLGLADDAGPPTDAALLTRYAVHDDHAAFAELLRRHGPTVLGVCRRILPNPADADDAFQATFLVLARKADSVRPPGMVGVWLYGVAVRTASKAKVAAARRWRREMTRATASESPSGGRQPPEGVELSDLRAVIDEELGRLPESLRGPVVLCDLGGKTRSEAARELGWPEGTVAARLAKARRLLGERLSRRGVALPAAGLATLLTAEAVPAALAQSTLAAIGPFAAGLASSAVSPAARSLAEGTIRTMTTGTFKLAGLALAAGLLAGTGILWAGRPGDDPPVRQPGGPPAGVVALPAANNPPANTGPWRELPVLDHTGWLVGSVAFSPEGKLMVVGGTDGHVRAYTTDAFRRLWDFNEDAKFAAVAFHPDGKTLAVTHKNGLWFLDPATGKHANEGLEEKESEPIAVAFFPDQPVAADGVPPARKVIFGDDCGYHVKTWIKWPAVGGVYQSTGRRKPNDLYAVPLAVDPRGKRAAVTGPIDRDTGTNVFWAWSAGSGEANKLLAGHKAAVTAAAWSADGNTLVSGDADGVVVTWDARTFKETRRLDLGGRVAGLAVTSDGGRIAAAVAHGPDPAKDRTYGEAVFVWPSADPPAKPEPISRVEVGGPFQGLASVAFSPDGRTLAAGFANFVHLSRTGELRGRVRVWRLHQPAAKPADPPAKPAAAALDGWKEKAVLTHHAGPVDSVAFGPDGKWFVSGAANGLVYLWDATTHTPDELGGVIPAGAFTSVAVSPDGKLVAATRDKVTGFFDPQKRQAVQMRPNFRGGRSVAFSPDGKWVATNDGTAVGVRNLPPDTGEAGMARPGTVDPKYPTPVAWAPDSNHVAFALPPADPNGDWRVGILGIRPDSKPGYLDGHKGPVLAVAWSPDGKLIASGDGQGDVILWDAATHKERSRTKIAGRNGSSNVNALAFSPDGATLAAAVRLDAGKGVERVVFVEVATGKHGGFVQTGIEPRGLAFSPDGRTLLVATGIDRKDVKPIMTPDERKAAGGIVVLVR